MFYIFFKLYFIIGLILNTCWNTRNYFFQESASYLSLYIFFFKENIWHFYISWRIIVIKKKDVRSLARSFNKYLKLWMSYSSQKDLQIKLGFFSFNFLFFYYVNKCIKVFFTLNSRGKKKKYLLLWIKLELKRWLISWINFLKSGSLRNK